MQVEIEKPLGLKLKASKAAGGGCVVAVYDHLLLHREREAPPCSDNERAFVFLMCRVSVATRLNLD